LNPDKVTLKNQLYGAGFFIIDYLWRNLPRQTHLITAPAVGGKNLSGGISR